MTEPARDRSRIDPLTGAKDPASKPNQGIAHEEQPTNAAEADIPGTGEVVRDAEGREVKRVVLT